MRRPRRSAKSSGFWPAAKKVLRYDTHGDLVADGLDDDAGANVLLMPDRWLARSDGGAR